MRRRGLRSFHGIIDRDLDNTPSDGVYIISRNGMENYLYDPLNVWLLLHLRGQAPDVAGVNVPRGREAYVRNLSADQLQRIVEAMLARVKGTLSSSHSDDEAEEEITFVNGKRLRYPRWFLYKDDKEIEGAIRRSFGHHLIRSDWLLGSYPTLNMNPQGLLDLLKTIQDAGKP